MVATSRHKNFDIEERLWIYALITLFGISRFFVHFSGISFDTSCISVGTWQLIAPDLLKEKLIESLYHLHSQPPLYNLYIGVVLKLFPENYSMFFQLSFLLLGLLTHVSLFVILRRLEVSRQLSFILTLMIMISPSIILYENWLSYTYIEIALLTLSALLLLRFLESKKITDGFFFFIVLAIIILTRSMYHLVWFAAVILLLFGTQTKIRKTIILSAALPFLIVLACFFKNYLLFNTFSTSSWMGMSLYELSLSRMDKKKLEPLIASGEVSPIVLVPAFWSLDHYTPFVTRDNPYSNVSVLTDSFNLQEANYHNYHYLEISELYKSNAIKVIKHYPMDYLKNVAISFGYYFYPASNYELLKKNVAKMFWYNKIYNHLILWTVYNPEEVDRKPPFKIQYALSLSFFIIFSFIVCITRLVYQWWKQKSFHSMNLSSHRIVVAYIVLTILYTMVVGNFFEQGENMRFRFQTSTLCIIMFGLILNDFLPKKIYRNSTSL